MINSALPKKAVLLLSGGLDSTIALHLMKEEGIEMTALHFSGPFCTCNAGCPGKSYAAATSEKTSIKYLNVPMREDYLEIVKKPDHGYGKNMNPCLDCRIYKFRKAKEIMKESGASFIITGEVLGQRPMSQHLAAMNTIEKEAELEGLVLRPLSAKNLEPTIPEKKGWVRREKLLEISGRSRKEQLQLADIFGIDREEYACPAGGCRLTNREYADRIRDIIENSGELKMRDIHLLNYGRHLRVDKDFKFIVGRDEAENRALNKLARKNDIKLSAKNYTGPLCVGLGRKNMKYITLMADVCGFYDSSPQGKEALYKYEVDGKRGEVTSSGISLEEIDRLRI